MSDSLRPQRLQHTRLPCSSPSPWACSTSCPLSWWCHPTILSSVIPFSSCLQSFPVSGSFQMSQFFTSGGQSIGVSASTSVLPMNIQDWFPLGWTCWISLQSKGLSRVSSNTTIQKHLMLIWDTFLCSLFIEQLLCARLSRHWDYSCGLEMAPRGPTLHGGKSQTVGTGLVGSNKRSGG